MLVHLVFHIVTSHKCASRLINIKSLSFAICTKAYFTAAPFFWEFEFWRNLESNGDTRELKKINLLSGNCIYLLKFIKYIYFIALKNECC